MFQQQNPQNAWKTLSTQGMSPQTDLAGPAACLYPLVQIEGVRGQPNLTGLPTGISITWGGQGDKEALWFMMSLWLLSPWLDDISTLLPWQQIWCKKNIYVNELQNIKYIYLWEQHYVNHMKFYFRMN